MVVKTFRGLLADGGQDRLNLSTIKGKVGYTIIKFQTIGKTLGTTVHESTCQIWKVSGESIALGSIDFSDGNMLGVAFWKSHGDTLAFQHIIFDREVFNQDIFVTNQDTGGDSNPINYYIELEVIPLASDEATLATLKDIKLNA